MITTEQLKEIRDILDEISSTNLNYEDTRYGDETCPFCRGTDRKLSDSGYPCKKGRVFHQKSCPVIISDGLYDKVSEEIYELENRP